jgi:hypothetical protein
MNEIRNISKQNYMPPNWGASNFLSKCSMIYERTNTIFGNVVEIHKNVFGKSLCERINKDEILATIGDS